jgi:hypothetical protein
MLLSQEPVVVASMGQSVPRPLGRQSLAKHSEVTFTINVVVASLGQSVPRPMGKNIVKES